MEYSPGRRDSTTLSLEPSWLPSILFMLKFQNRFIKYFFVISIIIIVYSLLSPLYPIDLYFAKCSITAITPLLGLNTTCTIHYLDCLLRYLTFSLDLIHSWLPSLVIAISPASPNSYTYLYSCRSYNLHTYNTSCNFALLLVAVFNYFGFGVNRRSAAGTDSR